MAQKNTNSSGGRATGSTGEICFSIGQIDYHTINDANIIVSQGLQQPYEIQVLSGINVPQIELNIRAFPNPTSTKLILSIPISFIEGLNYDLFDANGKWIMSRRIDSTDTMLDLENLSNGCYFIQITKQSANLKTFKIIKSN